LNQMKTNKLLRFVGAFLLYYESGWQFCYIPYLIKVKSRAESQI